ncbi:PucR family transcriptional regulator [Patulibacter defluvii]|uniref:PucR family transcriptional regulator n=1 Tax=Patulibacter defluvii TaxID=3095358 RepID=UPI002A75F586|nr:helix-turn-helix domain-containing protein [Patulibacter sp. DM4]
MTQRTASWHEELVALCADPAWHAEVAERVARLVHEQLDELDGDVALMDATRQSIEDKMRLFAAVVAGVADSDLERLPPMAAAHTQAMVRRGVSAPTMMQIYRIAHEVTWQALLVRLKQHFGESSNLAAALERAATVLQRFETALSDALRRESEQSRDRAGLVARAVERILTTADHDASWIQRQMQYDLTTSHVAVAAWWPPRRDGLRDEPGERSQRLDVLLDDLDVGTPLVVDLAPGVTAAWISVGPLAGLEVPAPLAERHGLHVAVGRPHHGVEGFRRSYHEALEAYRIGTMAPDGPPVVRYADVALVSLIAADEPAARAFMERQLGELLAPGARNRVLRRTLTGFLEARGRSSTAAEIVGVHVNTVINRVRTAEELLPPTASRDSDLLLALRLTEWLR